MPTLAPTWDLFILVFFSIIIAYSFIVGRNATLKIIIATYIAILATDGIGNLLERLLTSGDAIINLVPADSNSIIVIKILLFVLGIVILTIRGTFFVESPAERSALLNMIISVGFGFLSAGLIVSTIMVYMSGGTFVAAAQTAALGVDIARTSYLARTMMENYDVWFALPAIALLAISFSGGGGGGGHEAHGEE